MKIIKLLSRLFSPTLLVFAPVFSLTSCGSNTQKPQTDITYTSSNSDGSSSSTVTFGNTMTITASGTDLVGKFGWSGVMFEGDNGYDATVSGTLNETLKIKNTNLTPWDVNIFPITITNNKTSLQVSDPLVLPTAIITYTTVNSDVNNPTGMTVLYNGTLTLTASSPNLTGKFLWDGIPTNTNYTTVISGDFNEKLTITNKNTSNTDLPLNVTVSDNTYSVNIDPITLDTGVIDYTLTNSDPAHPTSPIIGFGFSLTITASALNPSGDFNWAGISFDTNDYYTATPGGTDNNTVTITNKNSSASDYILDQIVISNNNLHDSVEPITVDTNIIDYTIVNSNPSTPNSPIIIPGGKITITAIALNRVGPFSWGTPKTDACTFAITGDYDQILTITNTNSSKNDVDISNISISNNGYTDSVEKITVISQVIKYKFQNSDGSTSPRVIFGNFLTITAQLDGVSANFAWNNIQTADGYTVSQGGEKNEILTITNTNYSSENIIIPPFSVSNSGQTTTITETITMVSGAITYTISNDTDPNDPTNPNIGYNKTLTIVADISLITSDFVWNNIQTSTGYSVSQGGTRNNTLTIKSTNLTSDDISIPSFSVSGSGQQITISEQIVAYTGKMAYTISSTDVAINGTSVITVSTMHSKGNFNWSGLTIGTGDGIQYIPGGQNKSQLTIINGNIKLTSIIIPPNTISVSMNGYTITIAEQITLEWDFN